jgi:polyribonucleotide nucleotidyltransferase
LSFKVEKEIAGRTLSLESGKIARQAGGAVTVRYEDTMVLATAVSSTPKEKLDFFPLIVEYREMFHAVGRIPGGRYYKREGRPTIRETLTMRLVDRSLRPLFPENYQDEVQIVSIVLSADKENTPDILGLVASSAALSISNIPFWGPVGVVRVGLVDDEFVINPRHSQIDQSTLNLVIVTDPEGKIVMMEGFSEGISEARLVEAIACGSEVSRQVAAIVQELVDECGLPKQEISASAANQELYEKMKARAWDEIDEKCLIAGKLERTRALEALTEDLVNEFSSDENGVNEEEVQAVFQDLEREVVRQGILKGRRPDGRSPEELRPVACEVAVLPRTHGSALFTRGNTQALVTVTLGTVMDEEMVESLEEDYTRKFMVHYNFPPFSVGEVRPIRGPSRREIGHGALAERSLEAILPEEAQFPYTIRVVSDILGSNGSSSMATICGGTLCMMDAGIPIKDPVGGISIGLVKEKDEYRLLTDIQGAEDHFGDMDFKVAGTQHGVTGLQLDLKIKGIDLELVREALEQARQARLEILRIMLGAIDHPREEVSVFAPKLARLQIDPEKIGMVIGPGGKIIRAIEEDTGANVEIEDDGTVTISAQETEAIEEAKRRVEELTAEVEVGQTYSGRVVSIREFGCFVEVLPGKEGLVHISELAPGYVERVEDITKVGDYMKVKVIGIDDQNRIRLSRKAALEGDQ